MKAGEENYRSLWFDPAHPGEVKVIDQRALPWELRFETLTSAEEVYLAIRDMMVRGAPVIGALASFGMYLYAFNHNTDLRLKESLDHVAEYLISSRPTAVNLAHAVRKQQEVYAPLSDNDSLIRAMREEAVAFTEAEVAASRSIGEHGMPLLKELAVKNPGHPVNILTHCNAGWLATIDYGTALAPVYEAHRYGIAVHVWVDETRPRNQGARLTMWELQQAGVPCTLIADNTGGHLMQHGLVDIVITGSDRTTRTGDTANKIGTYLKALAARDNNIPFYVALPTTSIDLQITDGLRQIPIEERPPGVVTLLEGMWHGERRKIRIVPEETPVSNYAFDVTPARLITGLITEKGICRATEEEILGMMNDDR
jgi:methylthioribose-1-phosphate isomerase